MVVMVRTLRNFFVAKKDRWEILAKKGWWELWGRFSCGWEPQLPGFTRSPTGFNRCLGEVSSHHVRGQPAKKSYFVRIVDCSVTSLFWCSAGWGCGSLAASCGTTRTSPQPARGIITPSASSENTISEPQRIILLPLPPDNICSLLTFFGQL